MNFFFIFIYILFIFLTSQMIWFNFEIIIIRNCKFLNISKYFISINFDILEKNFRKFVFYFSFKIIFISIVILLLINSFNVYQFLLFINIRNIVKNFSQFTRNRFKILVNSKLSMQDYLLISTKINLCKYNTKLFRFSKFSISLPFFAIQMAHLRIIHFRIFLPNLV